ncbi:deoxynucleotidyltransferase terminal-interacting protein 2 [Anopheles marshallii]|uniref:deoxynucleotidyltransferase terminal-interacting protein 2 n=1 Tax=Anopheles marshallii TaxID=1521116 RepID=UPI00237BB484|nr:deoxynucleotidyltransferase terminal-interacting protein 2 [Anopheles marshallii]
MDLFVIDSVGDSTANGCSNTVSVPRLPETFINAFDGTTHSGDSGSAATKESDDEDYAGLPSPGQSILKILNEDVGSELDRVSWKRKHENRETTTTAAAQPSTSSRAKTKHRDYDLCRTDVVKQLKGAVLTPSIEKKEDIANLALSDKAFRKLNRLERKKTKGRNWFGMAAPQITPELQNELTLMKMRSILDPKQSFKRLDKRKTPKYFEIGKIIDSPLDHFNERGVKRLKSKSLVDELLADAEFQKFNKRKYVESLEKQKKKAYHKAVMKMKKEKKKSKKK